MDLFLFMCLLRLGLNSCSESNSCWTLRDADGSVLWELAGFYVWEGRVC